MFEYPGMLDDIDALESYEGIARLTKPNLRDYQTKYLLQALAVKKFICMIDTGLGKSYIAGAFAKALLNANESKKTLMLITNAQAEAFKREIKEITGLRVHCATESARFALTSSDVQNNDIIMLTHGCLNVAEHLFSLNIFIEEFNSIVIDEMHLLSNFDNSIRGENLKLIIDRFDYRLGLTATPITTDTIQLAKALYIIDEIGASDWKKMAKDIKMYGSHSIPRGLRDRYVVKQRDANNHKGLALYVDPMPHQVGAKGQDLFEITKGYGATVQHKFVEDLLKQVSPSKVLIYANRKACQYALADHLNSVGIRTVVINGDTGHKERFQLCEDYRNGKYDCAISNITTAIDLTSDVVLFYEFTADVKQFIGRAERTLMSKNLAVLFMFTKGTDEISYFYRNVYEISQAIQDILDINLDEVLKLKYTTINKI